MQLGRAQWVIVAAVVAFGSITAADSAPIHEPSRGVIAVIGDSNTMLGAEQIAARFGYNGDHFAPSYTPVLISHPGAGIRTQSCPIPYQACGDKSGTYWANLLPEILTRVNADMIVTDLGINDTFWVGTATTTGYGSYGRKIDWFMHLMPNGRRVLWTNLPCQIEPTDNRTGCLYVNAALRAARSRWPNLSVLDWAGAANKHPGYIEKSVHMSDAGYVAWATLVTSALDARLPK